MTTQTSTSPMERPSSYFAPLALLPTGWVDRVRIQVKAHRVYSIETEATPHSEDLQLSGPLLPGMPNVHSHAFQRRIVGKTEYAFSQQKSHFWTWREAMYQEALSLTASQIKACTALAYMELLKAGFTSVAEFHYLHHQPTGQPYDDPCYLSYQVIEAAQNTGIALTLLWCVVIRPAFVLWTKEKERRRARARKLL